MAAPPSAVRRAGASGLCRPENKTRRRKLFTLSSRLWPTPSTSQLCICGLLRLGQHLTYLMCGRVEEPRCVIAARARHANTDARRELNGRMIMKTRTLVTSAVAIAGVVVGATLARPVSIVHGTNNVSYHGSTSSTTTPAVQATGAYVFACVNKSGKIDYLEFRLPLPHQCWFSGESLWHLAALPAADPSPTQSASPSPSPTPSASSPSASTPAAATSPSASVSPSASASGSSSAASS